MTSTESPDRTIRWVLPGQPEGGPEGDVMPPDRTTTHDDRTGPTGAGPVRLVASSRTGPAPAVVPEKPAPDAPSGPVLPGGPDRTSGPDRYAVDTDESSRRQRSGGAATGEQTGEQTTKNDWKAGVVLTIVGVALTAVIAAPIALSSQHLYQWAKSPTGLNLDDPWAHGSYASLDLAALVCIGMTLVAAWRRERAFVFQLLVWIFAGTSAYGQHQFGTAEAKAGRALDAVWAMPAFALLGPLLLEVVLHTIRRWLRKDAGDHASPIRWLVAFGETRHAWVVRVRDGVTHTEALRRVRDMKLIKGLAPDDAIVFAQSATRSADPYRLRVWLADRGVTVTLADLEKAAGNRRLLAQFDTSTDGPVDDLSAPALPERPAQRPARRIASRQRPVGDNDDEAGVEAASETDDGGQAAGNRKVASISKKVTSDREDAERIFNLLCTAIHEDDPQAPAPQSWDEAKRLAVAKKLVNGVIAASGFGKNKVYRLLQRGPELFPLPGDRRSA